MTRTWKLLCFLCVKNHAFVIRRKREVKFNLFQKPEINECVVSSYSDSAVREWTTSVTYSTRGWVEPTVGLKKEKSLPQMTTTTVTAVIAAAATTTTTTTTTTSLFVIIIIIIIQ